MEIGNRTWRLKKLFIGPIRFPGKQEALVGAGEDKWPEETKE